MKAVKGFPFGFKSKDFSQKRGNHYKNKEKICLIE